MSNRTPWIRSSLIGRVAEGPVGLLDRTKETLNTLETAIEVQATNVPLRTVEIPQLRAQLQSFLDWKIGHLSRLGIVRIRS